MGKPVRVRATLSIRKSYYNTIKKRAKDKKVSPSDILNDLIADGL